MDEVPLYGVGHNTVPHPLVFPPDGGACKGKPTDWWFPEFFKGQTTAERAMVLHLMANAKRICEECPVRVKCLDYGLQHEPWGIWGGFDERERVRIAIGESIVPTRTRLGKKLPSVQGVGRPMTRPTELSRRDVRTYG